MAKGNSPFYRAGQVHGAYDAARPARFRRGYHPAYAGSWMYRRGFASAFLAARRAASDEAAQFARYLMEQKAGTSNGN